MFLIILLIVIWFVSKEAFFFAGGAALLYTARDINISGGSIQNEFYNHLDSIVPYSQNSYLANITNKSIYSDWSENSKYAKYATKADHIGSFKIPEYTESKESEGSVSEESDTAIKSVFADQSYYSTAARNAEVAENAKN